MGKRTFVSVMLACLLVCLNVSGGVCTQSVKAAGEDTASESKAKEEKEKSSKTKPKKKPKTAEKKSLQNSRRKR